MKCHPSTKDNGWKLLNEKCYAERHTEPNLPRVVIVEDTGSDESEAESTDEPSSSDQSSSEEGMMNKSFVETLTEPNLPIENVVKDTFIII